LCDFEAPFPDACEECQFDQSWFLGKGTQRIEDAVADCFQSATWQRMDSDSMRSKNAYEDVLKRFRDGEIDILVGTQMIAKGLHFPNVTCVGVIDVDRALQLQDFRAAERVFQLLVQVAGRAGRGEKPGEVFVQTFTPFDPAIQFARHHDVTGFQDAELEQRRIHGYPPYRRAAMITFRGKDEDKTRYCIEQAGKKLEGALQGQGVEVPPPGPAPIAKMRDRFRFQIFLLTHDMLALSKVLKREIMDAEWPDGVRATVDIDPMSLL
jgi:primosomal protein N' (replication factor Y)